MGIELVVLPPYHRTLRRLRLDTLIEETEKVSFTV
jgi:hypothetical protein